MNFFPLFYFSRKILTVTFWDFLKSCGGDTYLDVKKNHRCNYSLLTDLQVSDIGWFWSPNHHIGQMYYLKTEYLVLSKFLRCAGSVRFVVSAARLLYRLLWQSYRNVCLTAIWHIVWHAAITGTVRRLLLHRHWSGATSSDKSNIIIFVVQACH